MTQTQNPALCWVRRTLFAGAAVMVLAACGGGSPVSQVTSGTTSTTKPPVGPNGEALTPPVTSCPRTFPDRTIQAVTDGPFAESGKTRQVADITTSAGAHYTIYAGANGLDPTQGELHVFRRNPDPCKNPMAVVPAQVIEVGAHGGSAIITGFSGDSVMVQTSAAARYQYSPDQSALRPTS